MPDNIPHDPIDEDEVAGDGKTERDLGRDFVDDLSFKQKLRMTWRGQNEFGRIGGTVLNIAESFLPKYVSQTRNILQKTTNTMDKPFFKSKSVWGGILLVLTAVLKSMDVAIVDDPVAMENLYHVMYGLSGLLGITGLRHAIGKKIKQDETPS